MELQYRSMEMVMTRISRLVLSLAVGAALAIPAVAHAQAIPRGSAGSTSSGSSGSSSSGSSGSTASTPPPPPAVPMPPPPPPPQRTRTAPPSSSGAAHATPRGSAGQSGASSGSTATTAGVREGMVTGRTPMLGAPGTRDRNGRPVLGTAAKRMPPTFLLLPGLDYGFYDSYFPFYSGGFGWNVGYFGYDPWLYGDGRWIVGAYGPYWYDPWYDPYAYGMEFGGQYGRRGGAPRREAPAETTGSIRLRVSPDTAQVYVDGTLEGTVSEFDGLSQHLHLPAGKHQLEIRANGYQTYTAEITVQADYTSTLRASLKKK